MRRLAKLVEPFAPDAPLLPGALDAPLGELRAELEASTEGLEGRLRVEVPGGLE